MRKLMLILLVAVMTVPAVANVSIDIVDNADGTGDVTYTCTGDALSAEGRALMAGVALELTLDGGVTIVAVTNYKSDGESTNASPGYGVYMEEAQVYDTAYGWNDGVGDPIADPCDPPGTGGIGQQSIILELGALYDDVDPCNAPEATGTLCTIEVSASTNVAVALEATYRGGLVMEVGASATVTLDVDGYITAGCFDPGHGDYAEWQAQGEPECWCYTYQCYGDGDDLKEGDPKQGYFQVGYGDLGQLTGGWKDDAAPGFTICADYSRGKEGDPKQGYFRVGYDDLGLLVGNWKDDSGLASDCGGSL